MLVWPLDLPQHVDKQSYRYQPGDGRLKSGSDTGGGKVRRRDSNPPALVTAQLTLNIPQKERLEIFWETDSAGGTLPFWFPAVGADGAPLTTGEGTVLAAGTETLVTALRWFCRFDPDQPPPVFEVYNGVTWRAVLHLWRLA